MSHTDITEEWWQGAMTVLRSAPTDLVFVSSYAIVAALLVELLPMAPPVRAVIAVPLVLFVPGYALVAVVYPGRIALRRGQSHTPSTGGTDDGVNAVERMLVSFGASVALLPLLGGVIWATSGGFSLEATLFGLCMVTVVLSIAAEIRRRELPASERFSIRLTGQVGYFRNWLVGPSATSTAVNAFLVVGILVASATVVYAFAVPTTGESYTNAMLVTEQDGEFVASGYPTSFTAGESESMTLQLTNHEHAQTDYTVVVAVEAVEQGDGSVSVTDRSILKQLDFSLQPGQTANRQHSVAPTMTGENLRLSYYVYEGEPPENPTGSEAYRDLHVWISVSDS